MQFRDLPPLHFLPAFEATGRLGSVKSAAAELHLTASAVSQQVKAIEGALGLALFQRRGRIIRLTEAGALYLRDIQQVLSEAAGATRRVRQRSSGRVLRLSTADFIAYEFILPRLSAFRARFPGVELSLDATSRVVDFATCDLDAAIRIADGSWPSLTSQVLGDAWVAPVCAPALARSIRTTKHLRDHTLIEMRGQERRGWKAFMKKQGEPEPQHVIYFEGQMEAMRAAEQGIGVAFGVFPMTTDWVTSGRLAVPLPLRVRFSGKICFLHRKTDARDGLYPELSAWLSEQYAALPALPPGRLVPRKLHVQARPRRTGRGS
jgi:LysR family glycine cleavage system transcriptional activator